MNNFTIAPNKNIPLRNLALFLTFSLTLNQAWLIYIINRSFYIFVLK